MRATLIYVKETQNITLALPKATLKRVRLIAVERGTSVSGLLAESLATLVREEDAYERARRRHAAMLDERIDLGTGGAIDWSRESLHER
jgi:hypothetical protein